jgi:hypothetical protein
VEALLADAAEQHASLLTELPADLAASLPVDAQGVTRAIDHLAVAAGLSEAERRALIRSHAVTRCRAGAARDVCLPGARRAHDRRAARRLDSPPVSWSRRRPRRAVLRYR